MSQVNEVLREFAMNVTNKNQQSRKSTARQQKNRGIKALCSAKTVIYSLSLSREDHSRRLHNGML